MARPVTHFEVVGENAEALQAFYRDAFDWRLEGAGPGYAMAYPGGNINGGIGVAPDGGPGRVTFYIDVPDLAVALARIERLGGRTAAKPLDVPGGPSFALFADPEGHVVGLVKTP
jgi:predicted enzyme related to lactoylglutathione lyase